MNTWVNQLKNNEVSAQIDTCPLWDDVLPTVCTVTSSSDSVCYRSDAADWKFLKKWTDTPPACTISLFLRGLNESLDTTLYIFLLQHNASTHICSMCGNNLGPEGVLELWNALEHNTTVEELYLDITGITERGTENIVNCLSKNTSLKTLT